MMTCLVVLFWLSLFLIAYAYFLYPCVLLLARCLKTRPVRQEDVEPALSLLIPAFNEEGVIRQKLENSCGLDYPADRLQILVVSDRSTDRTEEIVREFAPRVELKRNEQQLGKIGGLSHAVNQCTGDIIVITDANSFFEKESLKKLVRGFADTSVGCVSGRRVLRAAESQISRGQGLYWRYENALRLAESSVHSTAFTLGAMTAIRRDLFLPLPGELEFDQVWSLHVVNSGYRTLYDPEAVFVEESHEAVAAEFKMHFRNTVRGFTMAGRMGRFLNITRHPIFAVHVWSRKVARWLVGLSGVLLLISSASLALSGPFYRTVVAAQLVFYVFALAGYLESRRGAARHKLLSTPFFLTLINLSAFWALVRYLGGLRMRTWSTGREGSDQRT
ncbi:MAG: glycosyltransferase family 2 protein [Armatimonadetes bacterium]|nr:glycosyltransferase family 2 protein [Armatimonadota bacterium]